MTFPVPDAPALGRWPRVGGWLIDYFFLGFLVRLVPGWGTGAAVGGLLTGACYRIVAIHRWGKTLGKAAVGAQVVDAGGGVPSWGTATVRWLVPAALTLLTVGVSNTLAWVAWIVSALAIYSPILWRDDRRGLHDLAAGTWVVETRSAR